MPPRFSGRRPFWSVVCLALFGASLASAAQLPLRIFTTTDGLPNDRVKCVVRDSHGYLWLCTQEGLARYDGGQFTSYRTTDGLPHASVNDVLETRAGDYWIALNGVGLARFHPERRGSSRFEVVPLPAPSRQVSDLAQDDQGTVWAATGRGLFQVDAAGRAVAVSLAPLPENLVVWSAAPDADGLWLGTDKGVARRLRDGRIVPVAVPGLTAPVFSVAVDALGRVWAGTARGLSVLVPPGSPGPPVDPAATGLESGAVYAVSCGDDGVVRAGGIGGLVEFAGGAFRRLGASRVLSVGQDAAGNVWFGTPSGAGRLARNGFVSYGAEDGLLNTDVQSIAEDESGAPLVATREWLVHRWDGARFTGLRFNVPPDLRHGTEGWYPIPLRDHAGAWWVPTPRGLYRFPRTRRFEDLARARPRRYTAADGLAADGVYRLFEDRRGDVWMAHHPGGAGVVTCWRRSSGAFVRVTAGLPPEAEPVAFGEDAGGHVWVGFFAGGLAREAGGRFEAFGVEAGAPHGIIRDIRSDARGRLWVTSNDGVVARVERPQDARPAIVTDPEATAAVAGGAAFAMAEDRFGRIYVGVGRGVLRLDGPRGATTLFTPLDGLPHGSVRSACTQRSGRLWFGATSGLASLVPEPRRAETEPPIAITAVHAAGEPLPISELGVADVPPFTLQPDAGQVEVEFVSVDLGPGQALRYAYRLDGVDREWHPPSSERRLRFAHLAPGRYRFLVRAVTSSGLASTRPAAMTFEVLQPLWKRPWFVGAWMATVAGAAYAAYRVRLAHLLAVERVRTRIATDLHDDLGSSLSRVAILSEVAKRQMNGHEPARALLDDIGTTARALIEATSDIIWAVDPRRDAVGPLAARVREFAGGLFGGGRASLDVSAGPELEGVPLDPGQRRHLYLLLKEALNNAARHAGCGRVSVRLGVRGRVLRAEVADDGRGFAGGDRPSTAGRGLGNMRERAAALGGTLTVDSAPGRGTVVRVEVPLGGARPGGA